MVAIIALLLTIIPPIVLVFGIFKLLKYMDEHKIQDIRVELVTIGVLFGGIGVCVMITRWAISL